MTLDGKTAVVTGASRGIGRAVALALAERGANVVVNYAVDAVSAEATAEAVRAAGVQALVVQADVRDLGQVRAMADAAAGTFGRVDVLVNNAGIVRDNLVMFMKDDEWCDVLDTNLKGAFHCIKVFSREMTRRRSGAIVNISSDAGLMGDMMRANYASAKAGLIGLTKTVARELASCGVRVNAVAPGIIPTDLVPDLSETKRARQLERIALRRFGTAADVANLVTFLASDDAAYITGQVVCVDGGLHM